MTTEDDFRAALDAVPDSWQTLAVFADWLRDRDDPRADGYAALAGLRRVPWAFACERKWFGWHWISSNNFRPFSDEFLHNASGSGLPSCWWDWCRTKHTRACEAFDAAARAFVRLPAAQRAQLLSLHGATV